MKKIILLPPEISQKIAAGEVIERPCSAVKELVENSLDAGASEIKVELLSGGKKLIRVTDNGQGMSREDARLCFERHSTSKIETVNDLNRIETLGFRGEALPSISAVSRVILKTSDGEEGTLVEREGEDVKQVSDAAFPRGTSIEVEDLFFNLPARRKFFRSDRAEFSFILKYLTSVSVAYPEVRFSLIHGKRQVFDFPPVAGRRERIFQAFGKALLERLFEVDYAEGDWRFFGYSSRPPSGRRDRSHQLFFVNRRLVKDRTLQAALNQAYRVFLEKDTFAEGFLFLTCPYPEVDINVHPAKAEVRFRDSSRVFQLVVHVIEQEVLKEKGIKEIFPVGEEKKTSFSREEISPASVFRVGEERKFIWKDEFPPPAIKAQIYPQAIGQYEQTYIIALSEEGIIIVDQHNAHERVLFEQYENIDREKRWPKKLTLLPVIFDFSPSQVLSFEDNAGVLQEAGFRVEHMGGRSYALREYPDIFSEEEARDAFLSLLEEMKAEPVEDKKKKMLATLACKTAVKAGRALTLEKMNYLLEELFKLSNACLCPHGRPVMVKISRKEIERGLRRS